MTGDPPADGARERGVTQEPVLGGRARTAVGVAALGPAVVVALGLVVGAPPRPVPAADTAAAAARVEPGRAYATLDELQARFPERTRGSASHRGATAFIASALEAAGARDVRLEAMRFSHGELMNVLGRIPGVDRTARVVLAAHHDTVSGAPGAVDDGGAVAVLIEAARVLASGPPPACDVEVAIFDLEEKGLVGSKTHLRRGGAGAIAAIRAALAVELVGWKKDHLVLHTIPYGFAHNAKGVPPAWVPATVRAAAADAGLNVGLGDPWISTWYQASIRGLSVKTGSDADAFLEQGVPACLLTGSALTNFYEAYHTPRDDMSRVDAARLDDAARVVVAAAGALAALGPRERRQGDHYLQVGERTLHDLALRLLGLALALPAAIAAVGLARERGAVAGLPLGLAAACLAATSVTGPSLLALVVTGPLALGAALGIVARSARLARACAWVSIVPALVELLLVIAASAMFGGFDWRGPRLEAALVLAGAAAALVAGTEVDRLRRPPRAPAAGLEEELAMWRASRSSTTAPSTGSSNAGASSAGASSAGASSAPSTSSPSTSSSSAGASSTSSSSTTAPSTGSSNAGAPSTSSPSTSAPSTTSTSASNAGAPSTDAPSATSTSSPSTGAPSTGAPSTGAPSTGAPSTGAPSTGAPSPSAPSTSAPSTGAPSTSASAPSGPPTGGGAT